MPVVEGNARLRTSVFSRDLLDQVFVAEWCLTKQALACPIFVVSYEWACSQDLSLNEAKSSAFSGTKALTVRCHVNRT